MKLIPPAQLKGLDTCLRFKEKGVPGFKVVSVGVLSLPEISKFLKVISTFLRGSRPGLWLFINYKK